MSDKAIAFFDELSEFCSNAVNDIINVGTDTTLKRRTSYIIKVNDKLHEMRLLKEEFKQSLGNVSRIDTSELSDERYFTWCEECDELQSLIDRLNPYIHHLHQIRASARAQFKKYPSQPNIGHNHAHY